ncbi:MAG: HAMP domain-containing sensor histidine kinase [bacterium]
MKLARRLMTAFLLALLVLLAADALWTVWEEVARYDQDRQREALLLGRVLAGHIAEIWKTDGIERAHKLIEDANRNARPLQLRWVWLDGSAKEPPQVDQALPQLKEGRMVVVRVRGPAETDRLVAYIPVRLHGGYRAALEVSQAFAPMLVHMRRVLIRRILLLAAMVFACAILVFGLGASLVGRPVQRLVRQARQIGAGDLRSEVSLGPRGDELSMLADEMNRMVAQLRGAQEKLQDETSRRIATLEELHHAERLATVGKFVSGLAHELGTPLNVISGRAKMVTTQELSRAEVAEYAGIIREQSDRMTALVQQLLAFSRRHIPKKTTFPLRDCVERVLDALGPMARERHITWNRVEETARPVHVTADAAQLQQVLTNIVSNAVQAMQRGGTIEVGITREEAVSPVGGERTKEPYACVKIRDQGEGIAPENLERIFDPFFTTKGIGEGTGLGLSIAYGIVREHGGWLAVESEPGKGSCFFIYLPLETKACSGAS